MNGDPSLRVRWSAVVVVPRNDQFLVVARGFQPKNINFPGGDSEPEDRTPKDTALRELREEAGLSSEPKYVRLMDKWLGSDGQPVYAFFVTAFSGRERSSDEGKTFWTSKYSMLTNSQADFRDYNKRLLRKLMRIAS